MVPLVSPRPKAMRVWTKRCWLNVRHFMKTLANKILATGAKIRVTGTQVLFEFIAYRMKVAV
ncbi:hypothetical protein [Methylomonas albis]|nr:hypothetical protein [Methylomonas albis]